jgi:hypothetical protein
MLVRNILIVIQSISIVLIHWTLLYAQHCGRVFLRPDMLSIFDVGHRVELSGFMIPTGIVLSNKFRINCVGSFQRNSDNTSFDFKCCISLS